MKPHSTTHITKEIGIGFLISIIATALGTIVWLLIFSDAPLLEGFKRALELKLFGAILSLGALLNFIAFYVFLNKNQIYKARGVVMASFVVAIVVFILKLQ